MTDLWELPFLWISDTAQHCAFLPGLPLLLPLHCYQHSAARNVLGACHARRCSGCVGKISVIMSIQLCLGFFNLKKARGTTPAPLEELDPAIFSMAPYRAALQCLALNGGSCHGTTGNQAPPCTKSLCSPCPLQSHLRGGG